MHTCPLNMIYVFNGNLGGIASALIDHLKIKQLSTSLSNNSNRINVMSLSVFPGNQMNRKST